MRWAIGATPPVQIPFCRVHSAESVPQQPSSVDDGCCGTDSANVAHPGPGAPTLLLSIQPPVTPGTPPGRPGTPPKPDATPDSSCAPLEVVSNDAPSRLPAQSGRVRWSARLTFPARAGAARSDSRTSRRRMDRTVGHSPIDLRTPPLSADSTATAPSVPPTSPSSRRRCRRALAPSTGIPRPASATSDGPVRGRGRPQPRGRGLRPSLDFVGGLAAGLRMKSIHQAANRSKKETHG